MQERTFEVTKSLETPSPVMSSTSDHFYWYQIAAGARTVVPLHIVCGSHCVWQPTPCKGHPFLGPNNGQLVYSYLFIGAK